MEHAGMELELEAPPGLSEATLREHASLVARGVRALAIGGHCFAPEANLLRVATLVERETTTGAIPFVLDHGDGIASYGYAAERWAIDLYEWAVKQPIPDLHRERIIGLLLGYAPPAITRYEQESGGRRFAETTTPS